MASTFTPLGVELQATGENAGTWGTKTNTNLELVEQISGGFVQKSIAGGSQTTALSVSDGATGAELAHRMIEFTGTISGNQIVTIPNDVQTFYILRNSTSGAHTVQFKYATGSGDSFTFSATDKGDKMVFASANPDATNPKILTLAIGTGIDDVVDDTSPQLGGDLDVNGNDIVSTSNADIDIIPNGTGDVVLGADTVKVGDSGAAATLTSNGAGALTVTTGGATDLVLNTNSGTDSSSITITDGADGNISLTNNGTGEVVIGSGSASGKITTSGTHDLVLDTNAGTNSGTITITDGADGNINIAPNGTGVVQAGGTAVKVAGKETIWVPAVAMYPNSTNGCADLAQVELSNGPEIKTLDFDKDSDEFAQFAVAFPKSWNEGTITFQAYFTADSTNSGTVSWGLSGVAIADNDSINTAFGTQVAPTAKAHSGTANDLDVTAESGAVTIAGSPSTDEEVFFQISRDVSEDSLTADAKLLGIKIFFTTDAANDA